MSGIAKGISLVPVEEPHWQNPEVNNYAEQLIELGFREAGAYCINEMPGLTLCVLIQPETKCIGVIYEQSDGTIWCDVCCEYENGDSLTYSNAAMGGYLDQMPGHENRYDKSATPAGLYEKLLSERGDSEFKSVTAEGFPENFAEAYRRETEWRNNKGLSSEEVRRVADGIGEEDLDNGIISQIAESFTGKIQNPDSDDLPTEHAVVINFKYGTTDLSALFAAEDKLTAVIEKAGVGELDGHEVAIDGSEGYFYMYGPDADALFTAIQPSLKEIPFMAGATVTKRYGEPDEDVKEEVITLDA